MKNILVSGASGIVGYGILRSLRESSISANLIGTTIYEDSVAQAFCDLFIKAPLTTDEGYIDWLVNTIEEHDIDMLIPGIEVDMYMWAKHIDTLERGKAKALINNIDLISLCADKWEFYQYLKKVGCPYIIPTSLSDDYQSLVEKFGLPMLLKPRQGFGSKGIRRIYNKESFFAHKDKIGSELMVQPLIGNEEEEFTTSAFCDGEGGYYNHMTLRRKLSSEGFTEKGEVVDLEGVEEGLMHLCRILKPTGPTNFQFRLHNRVLFLLEINPRISSSTSIRTSFGYNEAEMSMQYYLENTVPAKPEIRKGRAVRYVEDYIFYQ